VISEFSAHFKIPGKYLSSVASSGSASEPPVMCNKLNTIDEIFGKYEELLIQKERYQQL
jgi:hypothetical protein